MCPSQSCHRGLKRSSRIFEINPYLCVTRESSVNLHTYWVILRHEDTLRARLWWSLSTSFVDFISETSVEALSIYLYSVTSRAQCDRNPATERKNTKALRNKNKRLKSLHRFIRISGIGPWGNKVIGFKKPRLVSFLFLASPKPCFSFSVSTRTRTIMYPAPLHRRESSQ